MTRPISDWVRHTAKLYAEALSQLKSDPSTSSRTDNEFIAAASVVTYSMIQETQIHEQELLSHLYRLHGQEPPKDQRTHNHHNDD